MNILNPASDLMQRYLKSVARYLPLNKRNDISREIESMILDMCEERWGESEIDERRMESILVELGKPSKLAAKYKETQPLIGPELMPIFKLVLLVVCLVTTIVSVVNFALSAAGMSAGDALLYFLELFGSLTSLVGSIFIVFVILERAIKNKSEIDFDDDDWRVKDLPEIGDKIPGRGEIIAGLVFSVIFIIALNIFIDRVGIYIFTDAGHTFIPILTEQFKDLLPMFSVRIAVGAVALLPLIAGSGMIKEGSRNYYYRLSQLGLTVFDIGILILLISRGFNTFFLAEAFETAGVETLSMIIPKIYNGVIILLLALSGWNLVKHTLVILPKTRLQ